MSGAVPDSENNDLVAVAKVVKVRGLKGEVVADLLTDFPERFEGLDRLILVTPDGSRRNLRLEDHWLQAGRVVLKFAEFDEVESAKALVGCELSVPEAERVRLSEDEYYDWELVGCRAENPMGELIGKVREVLHTGANDVLVIAGPEREHLIPLAADICTAIDIERKVIQVDPPEGLLEL
jgi:16S rRNA processing protein RimM